MGKVIVCLAAIVLFAGLPGWASAQAFSESFDNVGLLAGNGWFIQNNSTPLGANSWFQGTPTTATPDPGPFNAYSGAVNSYIGVNFASTSGGTGTISNWLGMPNRTLRNGDVFTFYTRKPTIGAGQTDYPDRLEVRLSTNGASTNVGANATAVGDFTTLMLSVNPTLVTNVYPQVWTQYTITMSGLPAPTSGRMAFRYFVTNGGPTGTNSDYIGIDDAAYTPYTCPAFTMTPGGALNGGTAFQAYSTALSQTGALGAPMYAATAGVLPPGLTLSSTGTISGTPTAVGTFVFTATVVDASGCSGSQSYSITIDQATQTLTFPSQSVPSRWFDAGTTFEIDPQASSGPFNSGAPIVYSSLSAGVCSVSGTTVTMVAIGGCQIAADQAGDSNYTAAAQVQVQVMLLTPTEADLWVQKSAGSATARIGDTVVYSILVGNDGLADAVNVRVLDVPPTRLDPTSVVWSCVVATGTVCPDPDAHTGPLDATIAALPRNAALHFQLSGRVIPAVDPNDDYTSFDNTASVSLPVGSGLTDPAGNDQSTASVLVTDGIFTDGFEPTPP